MTEQATHSAKPRRGRRVLRWCWRCARTITFCVILVIVAAIVHLHNVGLPAPLERYLTRQLESQGLEVSFSKLRLRWQQGVIAESIHIKPAQHRRGPQWFVERVHFQFDWDDLRHFKFTPQSLLLRNGRCIWELHASNQPPQCLTFENVQGMLRHQPPDDFQLTALSANLLGIDVRIEANVTNALHLRDMKWPKRESTTGQRRSQSTEELLHSISKEVRRWTIHPSSSLLITLDGDMMETNSFRAGIDFKVARIESPWLNGTNVTFWAKILPPPQMDQAFELRYRLEATDGLTPWGGAEELKLEGTIQQRLDEGWPLGGRIHLQSAKPSTPWVELAALRFDAEYRRLPGDPGPLQMAISAQTTGLKLPGWSTASDAVEGEFILEPRQLNPLRGYLEMSSESPITPFLQATQIVTSLIFTNDPNHTWWIRTNNTNGVPIFKARGNWRDWLGPASVSWTGKVDHLSITNLHIESGSWSGAWSYPNLALDSFQARLNQGEIDLKLNLDAESRKVNAWLTNTTEIRELRPWFGTNTQRWLSQYAWDQPPHVGAHATIQLPEWNRLWSWLETKPRSRETGRVIGNEIADTLHLHGHLKAGSGAYRGARFSTAQLTFHGSNDVWWLPDIHVTRPEGTLDLQHLSNETTRDYFFRFDSHFHPHALLPMLPPNAREGFDLFQSELPPYIRGEVHGRWRSPELIGVKAALDLGRFSFRKESMESLHVEELVYTNRLFRAQRLSGTRPEGKASVGDVWFHLDDQKLRLTNVVSDIDVATVCRAIGPKVAETMEDYVFHKAPHVEMHGVVDTLKKRNENDLHFQVRGQDFAWKAFRLPQVQTRVDWVGDTLDLTDFTASFYKGQAQGNAHFDFDKDQGSTFRFSILGSKVHLPDLIADISGKTNKLEGYLDGEVHITSGNTRDKFTWNGYGRGSLTNGLIWDIPVFAVISPALNTIIPGIGNSRARQAVGQYTITNGVIYTTDLDIRANAMRMKASGSVDFDKRLNARMEAELLRDVPAVGFVLSKVLWPVTKMFEFKITGTLDQPKTDQLYMVPRIILMPFHPIRTLKGIFKSDDTDTKPQQSTPPPTPATKP